LTRACSPMSMYAPRSLLGLPGVRGQGNPCQLPQIPHSGGSSLAHHLLQRERCEHFGVGGAWRCRGGAGCRRGRGWGGVGGDSPAAAAAARRYCGEQYPSINTRCAARSPEIEESSESTLAGRISPAQQLGNRSFDSASSLRVKDSFHNRTSKKKGLSPDRPGQILPFTRLQPTLARPRDALKHCIGHWCGLGAIHARPVADSGRRLRHYPGDLQSCTLSAWRLCALWIGPYLTNGMGRWRWGHRRGHRQRGRGGLRPARGQGGCPQPWGQQLVRGASQRRRPARAQQAGTPRRCGPLAAAAAGAPGALACGCSSPCKATRACRAMSFWVTAGTRLPRGS
jgi:hypothetical protein